MRSYRNRGLIIKKSGVWLRLGMVVLTMMVVGFFGMLGVLIYVAKDLPSPDKVVRKEGFATKIYDRKGVLLYDVYDNEKRTPVKFEDIPLTLRQATIAIEDKNFYKHSGFDPLGIIRAVLIRPLTTGRLEGGSTLTQQLVKSTLLTSQRTVSRKIKEFILALQVENKYSKDQILQMYLNEVPYGGTAFGVQAASEAYFNKSVSEINLTESAILAGLPQSPSRYSPFAGKLYIDRAKDVLRRMREEGYITTEEEKKADEDLTNVPIASTSGVLKAPHFVFYVKSKLEERYGAKAVEEGGLNVTTSLDWELQDKAQQIVASELDKVKHLKISNGAVVVMDVNNGQILTMVGSKGWSDANIDGKYNVATAVRQPGSSIKPVTYLTGLKRGYTAATLLMDTKTSFPGGDKPEYVPENYDGKFRGPVLVREALANSLNVPAVKMVSLVGIGDMLQTAYDLGFGTLQPTPELLKRVGLSVTLGGGEVKLLDMTSAYSAFGNGGKKVEPMAILKVTDNAGRVLEQWQDAEKPQVISDGEAFIISSILSDPEARKITFGAATSLTIPDRIVAVKTGTTNDKRDNWTVGWSPLGIITGVWVGNNDNSPMKEVASGITGASPIWKKIMTEAVKNLPKNEFVKPDSVIQMDIDSGSGFSSHDGFASKKEFFIKGTEPSGDDPIHKKIKVCKGEGKLATPADISGGNYDEKEAFYFKEEDPFQSQTGTNKWQEGILNWLNTQADPKYHPPTETCGTTNPVWIRVLSPADKTRVNGNDINVNLAVDDVNNVTKVEVYLDGELKYTLTSQPWEITIPNVLNGKHKIDIRATDDKGFVGTRYVEVTVNQDWQ